MAKKLAFWYGKAKLEPSGEGITQREEGTETYLEKFKTADIGGLLSLYFQNNTEEDTVNHLVDAYSISDPTFTEDKKIELRVLAGIILYECVVTKYAVSDRICLWFVMYHLLGNDGYVPELTKAILEIFYKSVSADEEKQFAELDLNDIETLELQTDSDAEESEEDEEENDESDDDDEDINTLIPKINELVEKYNEMQEAFNSRTEMLYEQTQIMWWILGGCVDRYHEHEETRIDQLSPSMAGYLSGLNLAKRVQHFPGPYAAETIIHHVLEKNGKNGTISFEEFVDGIDEAAIEHTAARTPLLFAIQKKKETGKGCWKKPVEDQFGIDITKEFPVHKLSYEVYIESLYETSGSD